MVEAPVGHQCPECVARGTAETRQATLPYGGRRSADPTRTSIVLIGVNVLVWVVGFLTGGVRSPLFSTLSLSPTSICLAGNSYYPGFDRAACAASGATYVPGVSGGAWWQLLTSAFVHVDLMHIAFNMLALWFLGPSLERALGRGRFLALYLLAALSGSVFVLFLSDPLSQTAGASGAIFGLLGALLVLAVRAGGDVRSLLMWLGLNVAITVFGASWISWQGHLGGFVGGAVVALLLIALRGRGRERLQIGALAGLGVLLGAATLVWQLTLA
nr:rhomboid family intramembrane serine protease [Propioniciclava soli]